MKLVPSLSHRYPDLRLNQTSGRLFPEEYRSEGASAFSGVSVQARILRRSRSLSRVVLGTCHISFSGYPSSSDHHSTSSFLLRPPFCRPSLSSSIHPPFNPPRCRRTNPPPLPSAAMVYHASSTARTTTTANRVTDLRLVKKKQLRVPADVVYTQPPPHFVGHLIVTTSKLTDSLAPLILTLRAKTVAGKIMGAL